MKHYIFNFTVTPNSNDWWSAYRNETIRVKAESLIAAKDIFCEILSKDYCLEVSKSAKARPQKMYRDSENGAMQVGYVFTASTEIDFNRRWVKRYASIWAEVNELTSPF